MLMPRKLATISLVAVAVAIVLLGQSRPLVMHNATHLLGRSSSPDGDTRDNALSFGQAKHCSNATLPAQSGTTGPTFLFVVGLEGSGHHFFATVYKGSPFQKQMGKKQIVRFVKMTQKLLYGNGGLMTLHCLDQDPKRVPILETSPVTNCPLKDSVCLHHEVATTLRSVASALGNESLVIPINANGNGPSMASYPSNMHPCRSLEYPNIDFFYDACRDAGVDCGHVYLYRDPLEIMKSTLKRRFNKGPAQAMQLYGTMLGVIYSQLSRYSTTNFGCFGFYDSNISAEDKWGPLGELLGWANRTEFLAFVQKVYRPPVKVSNQTLLVPESESRYLGALVRAHDDVLELCRSTAAAAAAARRTTSSSSQKYGGC